MWARAVDVGFESLACPVHAHGQRVAANVKSRCCLVGGESFPRDEEEEFPVRGRELAQGGDTGPVRVPV
jgi:hypothetical protein